MVEIVCFRCALLQSSQSNKNYYAAVTYGMETMILSQKSIKNLKVMRKATERAMISINIHDKITNIDLRRRTKITNVAKRMRL